MVIQTDNLNKFYTACLFRLIIIMYKSCNRIMCINSSVGLARTLKQMDFLKNINTNPHECGL